METLITVLTNWQKLASVQALQAEFRQARSAPPPAAVAAIDKERGSQKRKFEDRAHPAPAQQAALPGGLVWSAPMPLLTVTRGSLFEVDTAAKKALNQLPESELVVVCAVGKYRGGKSFLLNRLMKQKSGFEVQSSSRGVTRGVWMWARWLSQHRVMLVLDTQGLFDPESDPTLSRNIFSLATLLSSVLLLNVESDLDESSLQQLAFVGEFADSICLRQGITGKQDQAALQRHFPSLVAVVRNWQRDLDAGVSEDDYLENSLSLMSRASITGKEISSRLCSLFPLRRFVRTSLISLSF